MLTLASWGPLYGMVIGGGLSLAFFSAALLLFRVQTRPRPDRWLAAFLVLCGLNIALPLTGVAGVLEPLQFLMAPLFAGYVRSLFTDVGFRFKDGIHAGPTVLVSFTSLTPLVTNHQPQETRVWVLALWVVLLVQYGVYLVASARWMHRYEVSLHNQVSNHNVDLGWLRWSFHGMFGMYLFHAVFLCYMLQSSDFPVREFLSIALVGLVVVLSFRGLLQKIPTPVDISEILGEVRPKYDRSALSTADSQLLVERLETMMALERPYLDPELTLPVLADRLEVPRNHLSFVLNHHLKKTFYDLVGEFRVAEVLRLMRDPARQDDKLLTLAFDAGFSSKPGFNAVFKKVTNLTPSQYRHQILRESGLVRPAKTTPNGPRVSIP